MSLTESATVQQNFYKRLKLVKSAATTKRVEGPAGHGFVFVSSVVMPMNGSRLELMTDPLGKSVVCKRISMADIRGDSEVDEPDVYYSNRCADLQREMKILTDIHGDKGGDLVNRSFVIDILASSSDDSLEPWYAMPPYDSDFHQFLNHGGYKKENFRFYATQLLKALQCLREAEVLHLDIKPANILLDSQSGRVVLADFGISHKLKPGTTVHTCPRDQCFTITHRPPECLAGTGETSFASDMFAMGMVFMRMLNGNHTVCGTHERKNLETLFRFKGLPTKATWPGFFKLECVYTLMDFDIIKQDPEHSAWKFMSAIPHDLAKIIMAMTNLNPKRRLSPMGLLNSTYFTQREEQATL